MKLIISLFVAVVLVGCETTTFTDSEINRFVGQNNANIFKLQTDMSKDDVIKTMSQGFAEGKFPAYSKDRPNELKGMPRRTESYQGKDGQSLEFWFYYTQRNDPYESKSDKHFTPLCFIDGKLKGWGRNFYDDTIKIRKEIIKN